MNLTCSSGDSTEPIDEGVSAPASVTDRFAAVVSPRAGSGRHDTAPRYMEPPRSSASALTSFADYRRRMRSGVVVVMDRFDDVGQVVERTEGATWRQPGTSLWIGEPTHGDENQATWVPLPQRASDCELSGPTLTYQPDGRPRWRVTIIDESDAEPAVERKPKQKHRRPDDHTFAHLRERLENLMGIRDPRYYWWTDNGGPLFCWTTKPGTDGRHVAFAAEQVGPGSHSGMSSSYRLTEDSVVRTSHRRAKAQASRWLDEYKAGSRRPWR